MILIFGRPGSLKPWLNQTGSHPFAIQSGSLRTATRNLNIQDSDDVEVLRKPDFLHLQDYDSQSMSHSLMIVKLVLSMNFAYRESFLLDLNEE